MKKVLLLFITVGSPSVSSNLDNLARHAGKHLIIAVERKNKKRRGSCPATLSLLSVSMSTCGKAGPSVHAFIKGLAIGRVESKKEIHTNEF